jgi:hypothetical protein
MFISKLSCLSPLTEPLKEGKNTGDAGLQSQQKTGLRIIVESAEKMKKRN